MDWRRSEPSFSDPKLFMGRRGPKGFQFGRVQIAPDVKSELTELVANASSRLREGEGVRYSDTRLLEEHEHMRASWEDILGPDDSSADSLDGRSHASPAAHGALSHSASLPTGLAQLDEFAHYVSLDDLRTIPFTFYAVLVTADDGSSWVFVRRVRGFRVAKPGRMLFRYGDALAKFEEPLFRIEYDFDFVVRGEELAVWRPDDLLALLTDTEAMARAVPAYVSNIESAISARLTQSTIEFVKTRGASGTRAAQQLRRLSRANWLAEVTEAALEIAVSDVSEVAPGIRATPQGLEVPEADIPIFLNVLEQRVWRGAFDREVRQAQAFSTVRE
ncbi:hypothetical protein [Agrococcus sp. Marseille-Q4369]|uniref:hypothetical protein n=1 Tax=Agrococcus sp. Marseille-Q4369 TaxID=2810513 RepID=UPI001B8C2CB5|nr:hypothetical protein [Agrococcus sp. Marseille-Q4369]QUW18235.1 hypothetical protein JSQ78_10410 [Agrococcus sp. Marseille-Q4369]